METLEPPTKEEKPKTSPPTETATIEQKPKGAAETIEQKPKVFDAEVAMSIIEEMQKKIAALSSAVLTDDPTIKEQMRRELVAQYDPNDELKEAKAFFAIGFAVGPILMGDSKNGFEIKEPFNEPITFRLVHTKRIGLGPKDTQVIYLAMYTTKSKRRYNFLMNHSKKGNWFFEHVPNMREFNPEDNFWRMEAQIALDKRAGQDLITEAQRLIQDGYKIKITMDIAELKEQLLPLYIERMKKDRQQSQVEMVKRWAGVTQNADFLNSPLMSQ